MSLRTWIRSQWGTPWHWAMGTVGVGLGLLAGWVVKLITGDASRMSLYLVGLSTLVCVYWWADRRWRARHSPYGEAARSRSSEAPSHREPFGD
ncbi:hypothetical protein [Streptomyces sp. NPDC002602]|uniref:hypothetical protein n=1 Tax=Streptomyces sp. NPDC002602 TaxID=3364654 RepID=UPI0036810C96